MEVNSVLGLEALLEAELEGPAVRIHVASVPNVDTSPAMLALLFDGSNRGWTCSPLSRLTALSCLAVELRRVNDDVIGRLLLNRDDQDALLLLKSAAWTVRHLGKVVAGYNNQAVPCSECKHLSNRLARRVVKGKKTTTWLHQRLPNLSDRVNHLLYDVVVPLPRPAVDA